MPKKGAKFSATTSTSARCSPYAAAATVLSQILEEKKSFKKLVYSKDGKLQCTKTAYAQVCQVLAYKTILDQIFQQVPRLQKDVRNSGLLHICVYELLFGPKQKIKGGGAVKRKIMQHEKDLNRALETKEVSKLLEGFEAHRQHCFPRYARINTLMTTTEEVCSSLLAESSKAVAEAVAEEAATGIAEATLEFYVDPHVPNLLVLPPSILAYVMAETDENEKEADRTVLQRQQQIIKSMIKSGKLILQDKSSCFSALCLAQGYDETEESGGNGEKDYIDACAAPGNKTQHLASLLADANHSQAKTGAKKSKAAVAAAKTTAPTIYAMDRSSERLASLTERMKQLVPTDGNPGVSVDTKEADFLLAEYNDFKTVGSIMLDPSCSGSGIYTAPDRWTETTNNGDEEVTNRIEPLANFQEMALCYAMSFPTVSRVVYSTCSLNERENEDVALRALVKFNDNEENTEFQWHIVAPKCLRHWKRRGHVIEGLSPEDAECMVRATNKDDTNGFFVCCFEKRKTDDPANDFKKSDAGQAAPQMVVPKGVTVYKGQFVQKITPRQPTVTQPPKQPSAVEPTKSATSEKQPKNDPTSLANSSPATSDKKVKKPRKPRPEGSAQASKKRDKKQAWKKRQMEQKAERLLKKLKT